MPDRVRSAVKKIDEARDKVRADDFFKNLNAESLVDLVLAQPSEAAFKGLAAAFIQRNQAVLEEGVKIGINLGKEFLK